MMFVTSAFLLAGFCFLFGSLSLWAGTQSKDLSRTILLIISVSFLFLSLFGVLAGTGFAIELTNQAPCENVVSTSYYDGNTTSYTYLDSCASRTTPETIERLYQAYSIVIYTIILVSVLALMFLGIWRVLSKW